MSLTKWLCVIAFVVAGLSANAAPEGIKPGDPAIGSYYYFAALDKKCATPDSARQEAIERYKEHYIANARRILGAFPAPPTAEAKKLLDDLEASGPPQSELNRFDSLFAKATQGEIDKLCGSATKEIDDRVALETKMAEAGPRANAPSAKQKLDEARSGPAADQYLSQEYLDRVGPPFGFLSIQHFYAILKRCDVVAPESAEARRLAFDSLLDGARSSNGVWRTFHDAEGHVKETHHSSARAMFNSREFAADLKRYEARVAAVPLPVQRTDCAEYESLVSQALTRR